MRLHFRGRVAARIPDRDWAQPFRLVLVRDPDRPCHSPLEPTLVGAGSQFRQQRISSTR